MMNRLNKQTKDYDHDMRPLPPGAYPSFASIETKSMAAPPPPPPKFSGFESLLKKGGKSQRSSSPDAEIRRMKTRLEKGESKQAMLADKLARSQSELKATKDELARTNSRDNNNLDTGFRVLNLDDPKEKKFFESEEKLKLQYARETDKLRGQIMNLEGEVNRLEKMSNRDSRQFAEDYQARLADMRRQHDREKMQLQRENQRTREAQSHDKWETQIYSIREDAQKNMTAMISEYESQIAQLQNRINQQETELGMTKADSDRIYDVMQQKHVEELTKLKGNHQREMNVIMQELASKSASGSERSKSDMMKMEEDHKNEFTRMKETLDRERSAFEVKFAMQEEEFQTAIDDVRADSMAKIKQVKEEQERLKLRLEKTGEELRETDEEREAEKQKLIADHQAEMEALSQELDARMEELVSAHKAEIANLQKAEDNKHTSRIDGLETRLRKTDDVHLADLQRQEKEHNDELAKMAFEREKLVKKLDRYEHKEGHTQMLLDDERQMRNKIRKQLQQVQMDIVLLREENGGLKEKLEAA